MIINNCMNSEKDDTLKGKFYIIPNISLTFWEYRSGLKSISICIAWLNMEILFSIDRREK